jgi:hypothetical protein
MSALQIIVLVLVVLWLCGFSLSIGGSLIHALVVIALALFIFDWAGRRGGGAAT